MVPADHLKASLTLVDLLGTRCDFESSAQRDKLSLISRRRKSGIFTNWAKRPIHSVSDGCEATEPQKNLKAELDLLSRCRCPFSLSTSICSRWYLLQSLPSNFVIYVCIVGLHILRWFYAPSLMFSVIDWLSEVNLAAETDLVMMKKSFVDFDFAPSHFSSIQPG